jgi:hypothetical protein
MIPHQRLKEILHYDPVSGYLFVKKSNRRLLPAEDGFVSIYDPLTRRAQKFKMSKLCYYLATEVIASQTDRILHKNLDDKDFRLGNLTLLSSGDFIKVKEAIRNLQGEIRITPHPVDVHSYRVHWYTSKHERIRIVGDITTAKRLELKLKLKYSKILSKYTITD